MAAAKPATKGVAAQSAEVGGAAWGCMPQVFVKGWAWADGASHEKCAVVSKRWRLPR